MNNFFTTSDNKAIEQCNSYESEGGNLLIPDGTKAISYIEQASWEEYQGERFIKLRWTVYEGEFAKRKTFQKVRVFDQDPSKADRAKRMLVAIDTNCGGELFRIGQEPTDMDLSRALLNKPMLVEFGVWETDDKLKSGNWIKAVSAKPVVVPKSNVAPQAQQAPQGVMPQRPPQPQVQHAPQAPQPVMPQRPPVNTVDRPTAQGYRPIEEQCGEFDDMPF